jgi:hypothetical protein
MQGTDMETLTKAFTLELFDLKLQHYTPQKYLNEESSLLLLDDGRLHRNDKFEVLSFINLFLNKSALALNLSPDNYIHYGQKVERMIRQAPEQTNEVMRSWLLRNWKIFP